MIQGLFIYKCSNNMQRIVRTYVGNDYKLQSAPRLVTNLFQSPRPLYTCTGKKCSLTEWCVVRGSIYHWIGCYIHIVRPSHCLCQEYTTVYMQCIQLSICSVYNCLHVMYTTVYMQCIQLPICGVQNCLYLVYTTVYMQCIQLSICSVYNCLYVVYTTLYMQCIQLSIWGMFDCLYVVYTTVYDLLSYAGFQPGNNHDVLFL